MHSSTRTLYAISNNILISICRKGNFQRTTFWDSGSLSTSSNGTGSSQCHIQTQYMHFNCLNACDVFSQKYFFSFITLRLLNCCFLFYIGSWCFWFVSNIFYTNFLRANFLKISTGSNSLHVQGCLCEGNASV